MDTQAMVWTELINVVSDALLTYKDDVKIEVQYENDRKKITAVFTVGQ